MATSRRKKPPSFAPWRCVILAVDSGEKTGVAIGMNGQCHWAETIHAGIGEARECLASAIHLADKFQLPLVIVGEKWKSGFRNGKGFNPATLAGLERSWAVWPLALDMMPPRRPTSKILRVNNKEWQAALGIPVRAKSDVVKTQSMKLAEQWTGIDPRDHNEADATNILRFSFYWHKVGELPEVKACGRE